MFGLCCDKSGFDNSFQTPADALARSGERTRYGADRRVHTRHDALARAILVRNGEAVPVVISNFSLRGIGLADLDEHVSAGETVALRLKTGEDLTCVVRWRADRLAGLEVLGAAPLIDIAVFASPDNNA